MLMIFAPGGETLQRRSSVPPKRVPISKLNRGEAACNILANSTISVRTWAIMMGPLAQ